MDQETLYTATKWDILKLLEQEQLSPIEISKITGSSLANVSSQLRLLEMAGLVTSERIPNREKGQPRILYSLAQNSCYVISTSTNFVEKKRLAVSLSHQIMLKIWFMDAQTKYLEKAFWRVEEYLPDMQALLVDPHSTSPVSLYVVADEKIDIPAIQELRDGNESCQMIVTQLSHETLKRMGAKLQPLYDPNNLFA